MAAVGGGNKRRAPGAGVVAGAFALNLDHVGAEIGQDLPGPRARQDPGKLQDAQTGQRTAMNNSSRVTAVAPGRLTDKAARVCLPAVSLMGFRQLVIVACDHYFCFCRRGRVDQSMVAVNASFFSDMLQSIADRSRALIRRERREPARGRLDGLIDLCEALLSGRGEASGVALASEILADYAALTPGPRIAFFESLARTFGYDTARIDAAIAAWRQSQSADDAAELHRASEPRRLELFRRLNLAPGGTAALVHMRDQLMDAMDHRDDLAVIDNDFVHLFSSWFNRGFLVLRRIDWSTSASILEKIVRYEAVHEIRDWEDLRRRIDLPDRRCYAFFHPALVDEPLIFVEVALTREIPDAIAPILSDNARGWSIRNGPPRRCSTPSPIASAGWPA